MANVYVRSGAGGAGTGADWANAYTTLAAACTAKAAGDIFWVSEDHAETQASAMTITAPGTAASPNQILCVNHSGTVPPVSADLRTTATISTTGGNAITMSGFFYCYGIIFQPNSAAAAGGGSINLVGTAGNQQRFDSCVFRCLSSAAGANITTGAGTALYWNNCSAKFGNIGDNITISRCRFVWTNSPTAIDAAGSLPTTLFGGASAPTFMTLEGVDLIAISGKTIFPSMGQPVSATIKDCKLPASITITAAQGGGMGHGEVLLIRCDSGAVNYRTEKHNYAGDQTTETTIIRTGGATDGTQGVAFKVITTANSRWADPFTCIPISIWNDSTSSVTATVYGIWGGGAVPNKEDIWIDVEYLGSGSTPQGSFISSGNADILATAANSTDASTWGGSTTAFKMAVTLTAGMKGPLTVYVRCAKASSTFYIDPKVVLT